MPIARSRAQVRAPQIDALRLGDLAEGERDALRKNADVHSRRFADLDLHELDVARGTISACSFEQIAAGVADFAASTLDEVRIDNLRTAELHAARSQWREVEVTGRFGSMSAHDARWRSIHFIGCKIGYLNLRDAELTDVAFTDCSIDDLDLTAAKAYRVRFTDSRIAGLSVQQSRLSDVDLRGADLGEVDELRGLKGAAISYEQLAVLAPLMAAEYGITLGS